MPVFLLRGTVLLVALAELRNETCTDSFGHIRVAMWVRNPMNQYGTKGDVHSKNARHR